MAWSKGQLPAGLSLVDARTVAGAGPEPVFRISRHAPVLSPEPDGTLLTRFLTTVAPNARTVTQVHGATTSAAVTARLRDDEPPDLVVDQLMSSLHVAKVAGVIDGAVCRVGLRLPYCEPYPHTTHGLLLTMTGPSDAPAELFPAVLYCWQVWSLARGRPPRRTHKTSPAATNAELMAVIDQAFKEQEQHPPLRVPQLPATLTFREDDGPCHTVRLHSEGELTSWPEPPEPPQRTDLFIDPDTGC